MAVPPHPRLWESSESARREYAQLPLDPIRQNAKLQPDGIEFALVLRVDFADKPGVRSRAQLDGWLFDKERSSLAAYYNEISYGKMDLQSGPGGGSYPEQNRWYRMPETMAFYGSGRIDTARYQALVRDALNIADADVNLRDFDRDGDNIADHLIILHSGDDEAATGFTGDIWSILISEIPGEWDGVRAEAAMVIAEEPSFNAPHLGVWFHEFLHDFGAPETYMNGSFASPNDQQYCLMGLFGPYQGGGTARDGSQPAHVSGYLKWDIDGIPENGRVGWITPIELDANTIGLEIPPFSQIGNERPLYKIDIPGKGGKEFFLLENRQSDVGARYDTALPDNGLLIWHVDESVSRSLVTVAQRLWVEDPSDPKHDRLDSGLTMDAAYSDEDGQTAFSPSTSPNSNANDGMTSEISILSIARRGTNMALDVFFGDTYEPNDTLATAFPIRFDQTYDSFLF
ncbi:MAG: immune inhibitor A, partial [Candidatus Poribacteria bacterium]|nr:immune inhibitor A [Candidatus Poribacteria bacterium]